VQQVLDKALKGLEDSGFAFPLVTKDGRRLEILLSATSRRDVDGHIVGMVGIGQDITARLAQEQEYSRLIDTANAPIFGVDVEGKVNVWNQHASRVVGFTGEETMGRPFVAEFITENFRASVQEVLDNALRGEETANFQLPVMTKSGARVDILLNATSRKDAEGRVIGVVGIGQDITARIAQEEEYSRLIDTANAPIFGVDMSGKVTVWNKCAGIISGYSSEDTMGRHLVQEFITVEFRSSVQHVLDKALRGKETANFQLMLMTKQGTRVEILLNATSRRDAEGHVIGMVGIGQVRTPTDACMLSVVTVCPCFTLLLIGFA
jgi:PAS domain S-box-containing protein